MQWRHWFSPYPELDCIQLEVSTFCNAQCAYCPRTVAGNAWANRHMSPVILKPLLRFLPSVPYVHLQGWGEPLLNPQFLELVNLIKAQGCRCGTTTNGTLLTESMAENLIRAGIDLVAFSLTGAGASHDRFRQGTPLATVIDGIKTLAAAKNYVQKSSPAIHIAYMLLRDGIEEIDNIPALIDGLAIDEIVVSTLDYVPHPILAEQVISRGSPEWPALERRLNELKQQLAQKGTRLFFEPGTPTVNTATCSEQVDRALLIAADGGIHPCVFANLPDPSTGEKLKCFGYLGIEGLDKTWWSNDYCKFRASFSSGEPDPLCLGCSKLTSQTKS